MGTAKTKVVIEAEDKTRQAFSSVQSNLNGLKSLASGIGTFGLGAGLSIAGIFSFTKSAVDSLDRLKDLSKSTHVAVDDLSGLNLAANQTGTDLEILAKGVNFSAKSIGQNGKYFKSLGIDASDPIERLKQLADVFNSIKDPENQATFANKAFGKSWQELAPLLSEGGASIGQMVARGKELSGVTQEMADQADAFNDQLAEMEIGAKSTGFGFAKILLPSLNDTAKEMGEFVRAGHPLIALLRGFQGLGKIPFDLLFPAEDLKKASSAAGIIKQMKSDLADLKSGRNAPLVHKDEIAALEKQISLYEKFKDKIDKPQAGKKTTQVDPFSDLKAFMADGSFDTSAGKRKKQLDELKASFEEATAGLEKTTPQYLQALQRYKDKEKEIIDSGAKKTKKETGESEAERIAKDTAKLIESFQQATQPTQTLSEKLQEQLDAYTNLNPQLKGYLEGLIEQTKAQEDLAAAMEATNAEMESVIDFDSQAQARYDDASQTYNDILRETEDLNISMIESDKSRAAAQLDIEHQRRIDRIASMEVEADEIDRLLEAENDRYAAAQDAAVRESKKTKDIGKELGLTFAATFEDAAAGGEKLSNVLQDLEQDLIKLAIRKSVTEPLLAGFDGLFESSGGGNFFGDIFSSLFGGGRAKGGAVQSGKTYLVGEKGPELLSLGASGFVTPNHALGGSGSNVTVNVINNTDAQATVQQRDDGNGNSTIEILLDAVKGALQKDIRSEGMFSQTLQSQYGLNRNAGAR